MYKNIKIGNKILGKNEPVFFVADIAANHDGDLGRAIELIWLAKEAGADAAKFQHFDAATIVSSEGFKNLKNVNSHQNKWNKSVYKVYEEASVSRDWTSRLVEECKKAEIVFFTSPYSLEMVDFIDEFVPAYKIGSGDITWLEIIAKIAQKRKPYMIATGASTFAEVESAVNTGMHFNQEMILMQCNTNYSGDLENFKYINLNVLKAYSKNFPNLMLGLSDHTPGCSTVLGAIALGSKVIEKHFTDNNERNGPDHRFSMDPKSWREMVDRSRELECALGSEYKKVEDNEKNTIIVQRRSYRATRNIDVGETLKLEDTVPLRPAPNDAISVSTKVSGKKVNRKILKGDYLKVNDVE
jgi:sialic acid synthase SpsE